VASTPQKHPAPNVATLEIPADPVIASHRTLM
jgi:hypothetical protein